MSRLAIIGPGAIGGLLAAWLTRAGHHEVFLCGRRPLPEVAVEAPSGDFTFSPRVQLDAVAIGPVDCVMIVTKAYAAAETARWLPALVGPQTVVAVLQNGVEHRERFAPYLPADRIVPVIVQIAAERPRDGWIRQRGPARLTSPDDEPGWTFAGLFTGTPVEALAAPDFLDRLWRKLCGNAPGILNALLLEPTRIMHDEAVADLVRAIAAECVAVGRAEGAAFEPDVVEAVLRGCRNAHPESINSMHADRLAGRPLEVDARNGVIVRLGRKHGIPTPCNQMAVTLLETMLRVEAACTKPRPA